MDIEKLRKQVNKVILNHELEVFSIKTKNENGISILEILIDGGLNNGNIDSIHNLILDEINDDLPDDFYLEVSSVGAERPIRNEKEMEKSVGKYVSVISELYTGDGELIEFSDGVLKIKVNLKGRFKILDIPYEKINNARWAIKF